MGTFKFIIKFLVGLYAIIKGADYMTDGAASIAKRFGISTLVIGMTIVAIGSSSPEFIVSTMSSICGNTDMAIGNVIGSNIFNILAIMGSTAFVVPVVATQSNLKYDVPFVILSSLVIFFAAFDSIFTPEAKNEISRSEGMLMLCMFAVFISYTIGISRKEAKDELNECTIIKDISIFKSIVFVVSGLLMLIFGGNWLVDGASGIALGMGVSQSIVALTIVSIGTSVPELAASLMAAHKGDTAMALGNVVGSVVFNVFFVLGVAASINPLYLGNITIIDMSCLLLSSFLLWIFCRTHHSLVKWEGAVMLSLQIIYYVILIMNEL